MKNRLIATTLKEINKELKQCRWGIRTYSADIARLMRKSPKTSEVEQWAKEIQRSSESLGYYRGKRCILEKLIGDTEQFLNAHLYEFYEVRDKKGKTQ